MSLINQMLRDLEQRKPDTPKPAPTLEPRPAPTTNQHKLLGLGLTALVLSLASIYIWRQQQTAQSAPPVPATSSASATETPTSAAVQLKIEPQAAKPAAIADPATGSEQSIVNEPWARPGNTARPSPVEEPALAGSEKPGPAAQQTTGAVKPAAPKSKPAAIATHIPPAVAAKAQKPAKTLSPEQQAEALYRSAQASSSLLMMRENLYEALQFNPNHLPARTLLLQTLLKSRASPLEISRFIDDSLRLFPGNLLFVKTRAHLYTQQKNFSAALTTLAQIDADTVDDTAYLSLLAASHQQLQHFPQAARLYQRLCQIQPDKAEHWLGLGMSRDKLNQAPAAAQAYRQALDKNTLNAEVVSYIKQRLGALN